VCGFLVLGPERLHAVLRKLAQANAEFKEASRDFMSELTADVPIRHSTRGDGSDRESDGEKRSHSRETIPSRKWRLSAGCLGVL
jgi:Sec-independent protein translocase protein TatA